MSSRKIKEKFKQIQANFNPFFVVDILNVDKLEKPLKVFGQKWRELKGHALKVHQFGSQMQFFPQMGLLMAKLGTYFWVFHRQKITNLVGLLKKLQRTAKEDEKRD